MEVDISSDIKIPKVHSHRAEVVKLEMDRIFAKILHPEVTFETLPICSQPVMAYAYSCKINAFSVVSACVMVRTHDNKKQNLNHSICGYNYNNFDMIELRD